MNASIFEKTNDKILFKIIKMVMGEIDFESLESSINNDLRDSITSSSKYFGLSPDDYLDDEYIYNVWKLNEDLFEENTLNGNLERPTLKKFNFNWDVWQTEWTQERYNHNFESYSDNKEDVINTLLSLGGDGLIDSWGGTLVEREVYESETTNDEIDLGSLTQIS
jgi:hypothetical protein